MKSKFLIIGFYSIFVFASCNENKREENNEEKNSAPPAEVQNPAPETVRVDKTKPDGTTIRVDENGVQYENKEGNKKSDVKISRDSSSIEITRPK